MQMLRAIEALGVDDEGDIIIPGKLSGPEGDMVREVRAVIAAHRGRA
jgi:hypothetical protein